MFEDTCCKLSQSIFPIFYGWVKVESIVNRPTFYVYGWVVLRRQMIAGNDIGYGKNNNISMNNDVRIKYHLPCKHLNGGLLPIDSTSPQLGY